MKGKRITAKTIREWREEIDADGERKTEVVRLFDHFVSLSPTKEELRKAVAERGAKAVQEEILDNLRQYLIKRRLV